jgi:hypothetical protein
MKRLGLALALSLAVGAAVTGSAASLGGITSSLGADDATVGSCDTDGVTATYSLLFTVGVGFTVDRVVVSGIATPTCDGKRIDVVLTRGGSSLGAGFATVSTTGITPVSMPAGIRAADVDDIHIAIN